MRLLCALVLTMSVVARPVRAQAEAAPPAPASAPSAQVSEADPAPPQVSSGRRALAIAAAIVPGFVLRGAGSWVAGEKRAAKRLVWVAAGGLAVAGVGGAFVGGTG